MTTVLNNSSWWPIINSNIFYSYWIVAAGVVMVYDWVLTLGQEIELIWMQRWSLMTVLYLAIRYFGTLYFVANIFSNITYCIQNGMAVVLYAMLGVIMVTRLHAMYQGSRMMLIFLVIIFLTVIITCGVLMAIALEHVAGEELILSGTYMCEYEYEGDVQLLFLMYWILYIVWEVLALCLSVWIAVKYFRDLRRLGPSTGSTAEDCFRVLIKAHMLYFASFVGVSLFQLASLSQSYRTSILNGAVQILSVVQVFVLGQRLILSVREHHAKLVAGFDTENSINSIAFQEYVQISTSSTV